MKKRLKKVVMTILTATMLCGVSSLAFADEGHHPGSDYGHEHKYQKVYRMNNDGNYVLKWICKYCGQEA